MKQIIDNTCGMCLNSRKLGYEEGGVTKWKKCHYCNPNINPHALLYPGAVMSECGKYRYTLTRYIGTLFGAAHPSPRVLNFIGLNPSTADAFTDDRTISKLIYFSKKWDHDYLIVTNLFGWRSTDPSVLPKVPDPVGPHNDMWLRRAAALATTVVVGWGNHGALNARGREVFKTLSDAERSCKCFAQNDTGHPQHPLYLPNATELSDFAYDLKIF